MITFNSEEETREFARRLGAACVGGEVILLEGPLGAGKTCFAGAFATGMGIAGPVPSPTFVLLRSYAAPLRANTPALTLHHFDFYRLSGTADVEGLGYEDCLNEQTVVLIEWPSRAPGVASAFTLRIELTPDPADENRRGVTITPGSLPLPPGLDLSPLV